MRSDFSSACLAQMGRVSFFDRQYCGTTYWTMRLKVFLKHSIDWSSITQIQHHFHPSDFLPPTPNWCSTLSPCYQGDCDLDAYHRHWPSLHLVNNVRYPIPLLRHGKMAIRGYLIPSQIVQMIFHEVLQIKVYPCWNHRKWFHLHCLPSRLLLWGSLYSSNILIVPHNDYLQDLWHVGQFH